MARTYKDTPRAYRANREEGVKRRERGENRGQRWYDQESDVHSEGFRSPRGFESYRTRGAAGESYQ